MTKVIEELIGDGGSLASKVELSISCTSLVKLDVLSDADPFVVLYGRVPSGQWKEIGRTETIDNCPNPKFTTTFRLDYYFEENQHFKLEVYDSDSNSRDLSAHDFIGEADIVLGELVSSRGQRLTRELRNGKHPTRKNGQITIHAEEVKGLLDTVRFKLAARGIPKMRMLWWKTDAFVVVSRAREDNTYGPVYKSEVDDNTLHPKWKQHETTVQTLCNGDFDRPLLVEVFHYHSGGAHELLGRAQTSLGELRSGRKELPLSKREGEPPDPSCGAVLVESFSVTREHSFLDYIAGGCEISLLVAIDFTASNGAPTDSTSLHYVGGSQPNEYEQVSRASPGLSSYDPIPRLRAASSSSATPAARSKQPLGAPGLECALPVPPLLALAPEPVSFPPQAIRAVGEILAHYDTDKLFPAWGFGAQLPPSWAVNHCFPLNGNEFSPECAGVQGVLEAYHQTLRSVRLHGPTIFSQIVRRAAELAQQRFTADRQNYHILLLLTDGVINDMEATVREIVHASSLPLSIVIVGVGSADFSNMDILDADDEPLRADGKVMENDIVQFVPFRDFKGHGAHQKLAKEVLAEIPTQFLTYMRRHRIAPMARPQSMYPSLHSAPSAPHPSEPSGPVSGRYGAAPIPSAPPAAPAQQQYPYEAEMRKLAGMGFGDAAANARALAEARGDLSRAVDVLMGLGGG
eukprot:tig00021742_g23328.t1